MRSGTAKSRHAWIYAARVERVGRAGAVVPLAIIVLFSVLDVAAPLQYREPSRASAASAAGARGFVSQERQ